MGVIPKTIDVSSTLELFNAVAYRLAGRSVSVRLEIPTPKNAWGASFPIACGGFAAQIDPRLPFQEQYRTLLHEVAHIFLGHLAPTPATLPANLKSLVRDLGALAPGTFDAGPVDDVQERVAEAQVKVWHNRALRGAEPIRAVFEFENPGHSLPDEFFCLLALAGGLRV